MITSAGAPSATTFAPGQHDDARAGGRGEVEVVRRQHDGAAQRRERAQHRVPVLEVERGRRFVEQQHGRLLRERAPEHRAPALAARQRRDRPRAQLGHADRAQRPLDRGVVLGAVAVERGRARVAPAAHEVLDRERELPVLLLRQERDAAGDRAPVEPLERRHLALVGLEDAGQNPQQRRLAAAVRADQRHPFPFDDAQVDAAQGDVRAVADGHPAHLEVSHGSSPPAARPPRAAAGRG